MREQSKTVRFTTDLGATVEVGPGDSDMDAGSVVLAVTPAHGDDRTSARVAEILDPDSADAVADAILELRGRRVPRRGGAAASV